MKADEGNCFVVMDRSDYDEKMQKLLEDNDTYEEVSKSLFKRIKRELLNYYGLSHGCAMGSPVSPVVANLCKEEIEELAHDQSILPPMKWFRFVDDVFSIIKRRTLTSFYNLLNSIDLHIKSTMEQELEGKLSFLDTLITRNYGSLLFNVYRKPTHTDRHLDYK